MNVRMLYHTSFESSSGLEDTSLLAFFGVRYNRKERFVIYLTVGAIVFHVI